jgi:hypothetical protein
MVPPELGGNVSGANSANVNNGSGNFCGYPEFQAEMARQQRALRAELDAWRERIVHLHVADRAKRMESLQAAIDSLDAICAARAADPKIASLPGGATGLG